MPIGPGKYDKYCTYLREETHAVGVLVMVFGGDRGSGFSVQATDPSLVFWLPEILRDTAKQIEESGAR